MLIVNRRKGEGLTIRDDITVTVREIGRGKCKLVIVAPPDVPIRRGELPKENEK